uniref:2-phosphosulfolactate phosphatase n=1 Tax=Candidatus Methanophagaceae archaeon ANME-1 ERB6 TaxID=2759912 RepID=A0A7G9YVC9_9EURY|nr:2-phosphosulfolactate phosphatase [Methanosarcinales archaeon ANME-1 ERB6]
MIRLVNYRITIGGDNILRRGVTEIEEILVVIDVLRASSTIVTALANGVKEVIPVNREELAFGLRKEGYILAGEDKGVKLPDFDLGNSPVELLRYIEQLNIEKIALKTTNSTELMTKIESALICSSLNLTAIKHRLDEKGKSANLLVVGSKQGITEDLAVAMALYSSLNDGLEINKAYLKECISHCNTGKYLIEIGYKKDVEFVSQIDKYDAIPILRGGIINKDEEI